MGHVVLAAVVMARREIALLDHACSVRAEIRIEPVEHGIVVLDRPALPGHVAAAQPQPSDLDPVAGVAGLTSKMRELGAALTVIWSGPGP